MSPRPKNPPPDRRQEILEAALRLFSEKGYTAATNAEIARAAGVTPAALYYYFPSKADLFKAAISDRKATIFPNFEQLAEQMLDLPPDVVLGMVAQKLGQFLADERTQAIFRIIITEGPRNPEVMEIYETQAIGVMMPMVIKYVQRQMDLGRLPPMDPLLLALLVNGSIVALVILRDLLKLNMAQGLTTEALTQAIRERLLPALLAQK